MSKSAQRVCLGAFAGAHGVRGDLRVKTFTQTPDAAAAYGPVATEDGAQAFNLTFLRLVKGDIAIFRAKEITSRDAAEALKGKRFYVDRSALPAPQEDEFYITDLVGLAAIDEAGEPIGEISAVHNFGAGDLIELRGAPGVKGVLLIAFTKENAPHIDLKAGRITLRKSLLDPDPD